MKESSRNLEFEKAAQYRDEIKELSSLRMMF
jgi:excinuclease UvrABC nuclease subunit